MNVPFAGLSVVKKFPSRKNAVYLVERGGWRLVLKLYDSDRWQNEADALKAAAGAGIPVPGVVEVAERAVLMELIPGRSVNDYLGTGRMEETVLGVADWLAAYHRAFRSGGEVRVKSDAIFKNFIVYDRIYGLDFELSHTGRPEEDVGEALAYLLDTDPMFTEDKLSLGRKFIIRYEERSGIRLENVGEYVARSLKEAATFRPTRSAFLLKKADEVIDSRLFDR